MYSALFNKIKGGVRFFFKQLSWKKVLTFSIFVFIATILWFMQIYNKNFETTVSIPISYSDIPDNIVILDTLPSNIDIQLKDNGFAMFRYGLFNRDTLRINVASLLKNNSNTKVQIQGTLLDQYIRNSISPRSQLINYQPLRISFSYAPLTHKKLPIIFDGNLNLSPGYLLTNDIKIIPDSVDVYGAKKDLDKLLYIYTNKDTISGVESNKVYSVNISPIPRIRIRPNNIKISVFVEPYVQKSIDVPVTCLNLPRNLDIKFFPSKVTLQFYTGVSKSDSIRVSDFVVSVDYESLKDLSTKSIPVRVISNPEYVRNLTISPPNVEFIFEHKQQY